jgi:hypothetical protein
MTQEFLQLQSKISEVRKRLKWITAAKGLAIALALSLVVLVVAVYCADHWNYSDRAVTVARLFSVLTIASVFGWFLVRPLLKRIEDVRVARYIEERHPALQDRLVSAVELGNREVSDAKPNPILPLLLRDALSRCRNIQAKSLFNPREPLRSSAIALGLILFFVLLQVFGPEYFQYATLKLYANWFTPQAVSLYSIEIEPGNVQVRKGSDQLVMARLIGFDSGPVQLYSRRENSPSWDKNPMDPQKGSNQFGFLFLDINEKVRYYAQSGNVRSGEFSIAVSDTARVEKIDLTYNFPGYTGLPVRKEEDGGEIAALKDTRVDVQAQTSIDAASARILLLDGSAIPMRKVGEKQFVGQVEVKKDSSYKIELTDLAKNAAVGSHEYPITALDDQPPLISFSKPGRDKKVTQLEEVLAEVKANDDFGLNSLKFHYTVNGGKENVIDFFQRSKGEAPKTLSGTHTFFLEEFNLEPGDVVSYYAKASDARTTSTSDIYFLEVRPFGKEYSQAQMGGGMGGGAGEAGSVLSTRQKEILAATWRLIRDQKTFKKGEYQENLKLVASQQQKLQQQTKTLSERIQRRALTTRDPEFQKLSENLEKALEAMTPAEQMLSQEKPNDALTPEQTALNYLMRSEAYFRKIQVAFGNNAGGPGGAATGAQELENLFELELDKLKNQYETQQQRNSMQAENQVDEALQKLKELAQRQQQLNERRRQQPGVPGGSQGGNQSEQQQIQEEAEKLARQLERLSREKENEEMLNASQRLKQAAQEMRNSSGSNAPTGGTQNRGLQALSRLNDARRMMENQQRSSVADDLKQLRADAQQAGEQQEKIQQALDKLSQESSGNGNNGSPQANTPEQMMKQFQKARQILQEKAELNKALSGIEQDLFGSARKAATQQKSASQQLQSAGNSMRDQHIQDRVTQSGQMIARGLLDLAKERERSIKGSIDDVKQKIDSAEKGLGSAPSDSSSPEERLSRALNQTGDLRENIESLSHRIKALRRDQNRSQSANLDAASLESLAKSRGKTHKARKARASKDRPLTSRGSRREKMARARKTTGSARVPKANLANRVKAILPARTETPSSQNGQANANANGGARGGSSPRGENSQNSGRNGERQNYGENYRGEGAINFGDYTLEPPSMNPQQARQFEKEFDLRMKEAQELNKSLRDRQDLAKQVQDMLERMKQMKSKMLHDEQKLERLQSSVVEGFRQLELDLSKQLQQVISRENLHLAKDEDVPEAYRRQVEEYYKALSKRN